MLIVSDRLLVAPQVTGEQWLVPRIVPDASEPVIATAERHLYKGLSEDEPVRVVYRRGRRSGTGQLLVIAP
jgi:hypothetical protein